MNQEQLRKEVLDVMENNKVGTLATIKQNKPHTRYMTFFNDEFKMYTPTGKDTYKVDEIEANPNVHILLGYNGDGLGDSYIEVEGKAAINDSDSMKEKLWNDELSKWFESPNDPNYVVLEISPTTIRYMNEGNEHTPSVLEL
ncbi:general stress protein 26 [Bacillus ectoiniformans]|uniref:pyridoxamine 5'-phosphate oxidase family protein n=1 Tax=Bacillus ectoiniformans TaxID=1494429 RepID=UPI0019578702|nr:pyridoxamine 5'-phosphate oxidase family protein [Bacillus ectoiniformans]MBM7649817.1 general stress protein 26 [Bacillus ectoiniformans]